LTPTPAVPRGEDAQPGGERGYKQELHRGWSGFSNFAISFSIISILAGCFTRKWFTGPRRTVDAPSATADM
jgi:hypothetical protein